MLVGGAFGIDGGGAGFLEDGFAPAVLVEGFRVVEGDSHRGGEFEGSGVKTVVGKDNLQPVNDPPSRFIENGMTDRPEDLTRILDPPSARGDV